MRVPHGYSCYVTTFHLTNVWVGMERQVGSIAVTRYSVITFGRPDGLGSVIQLPNGFNDLIPAVTFCWAEARLADLVMDLRDSHASSHVRTRGAHDVFLHHRATKIVSTETKRLARQRRSL